MPNNGFAKNTLINLAQLEWQNRILILHLKDNEKVENFNIFQDNAANIERMLRVFVYQNQSVFEYTAKGKAFQAELLLPNIENKSLPESSGVLIGLDGTVKRQFYTKQFDINNVYAWIDTMPMRIQTLKGY